MRAFPCLVLCALYKIVSSTFTSATCIKFSYRIPDNCRKGSISRIPDDVSSNHFTYTELQLYAAALRPSLSVNFNSCCSTQASNSTVPAERYNLRKFGHCCETVDTLRIQSDHTRESITFRTPVYAYSCIVLIVTSR